MSSRRKRKRERRGTETWRGDRSPLIGPGGGQGASSLVQHHGIGRTVGNAPALLADWSEPSPESWSLLRAAVSNGWRTDSQNAAAILSAVFAALPELPPARAIRLARLALFIDRTSCRTEQ